MSIDLSDRGRGEKEAEARSTIRDRFDPCDGLTEMPSVILPFIVRMSKMKDLKKKKTTTEPLQQQHMTYDGWILWVPIIPLVSSQTWKEYSTVMQLEHRRFEATAILRPKMYTANCKMISTNHRVYAIGF